MKPRTTSKRLRQCACRAPGLHAGEQTGAGDEVRTRDPQLGRLTLYQLSYSRPRRRTTPAQTNGGGGWIRTNVGVSQRVYSPPPLAARALHQKLGNRVFSNRATQPLGLLSRIFNFGAGEGSRTPDLLITSQLLYQLSYASENRQQKDSRLTETAARKSSKSADALSSNGTV